MACQRATDQSHTETDVICGGRHIYESGCGLGLSIYKQAHLTSSVIAPPRQSRAILSHWPHPNLSFWPVRFVCPRGILVSRL